MEAAARLQRHPQSRGASRHHSSDGSNNASSKGMHLCWWVSLVPSVQPWGWLHPRCLQDGILIIYLTAAPSQVKILLSLRHQPDPRSTENLSLCTPPRIYSSAMKPLAELKRKKNLLNPQSQEKFPAFKGLLKIKKKASQEKKVIHMNEPVLYFIPLNFMPSALFANNYNAMKGKVRNKELQGLVFIIKESWLQFEISQVLRLSDI